MKSVSEIKPIFLQSRTFEKNKYEKINKKHTLLALQNT